MGELISLICRPFIGQFYITYKYLVEPNYVDPYSGGSGPFSEYL